MEFTRPRLMVAALAAVGLAGCVAERSSPPPAPAAAVEPAFTLTPGATIEVGGKAAEVPFAIERTDFTGGDVITIEKVLAALPRWQPGDTIVVRGRYVLASQPTAVLGLFIAGPAAGGTSDLRQRTLIRKGAGTFEFTCEIPPRGGEPHVSFYPSGNGGSFGGVYF